jgi:hypothetical protein
LSYFSELSPDVIEKLFEIYEPDFEMFDYSAQPFLGKGAENKFD